MLNSANSITLGDNRLLLLNHRPLHDDLLLWDDNTTGGSHLGLDIGRLDSWRLARVLHGSVAVLLPALAKPACNAQRQAEEQGANDQEGGP